MIEFTEAARQEDQREHYYVHIGNNLHVLGIVDYSEKESKFIYSPQSADDKGNYHLAEIAELVEFLNKGERG